MSEPYDIQSELETLRAEVAELRDWRDRHVCGGGGNSTVWYTQQPNMCGGAAGGAAGGGYTYTYPWPNTAGTGTSTITVGGAGYNVGGAAGMPPIILYSPGGDCA